MAVSPFWGPSCHGLGSQSFGLPGLGWQLSVFGRRFWPSSCPNFGVPKFRGAECRISGPQMPDFGVPRAALGAPQHCLLYSSAPELLCCSAAPSDPLPPPPPISTPPPPPGRRPLGSSTLSASWQPCWASASSPPSWASPKLCPSCSPPPPWPWAAPWPSNCPKLVGRSCSEREGGGWKWG